jgi:hypothetical protein
MTGTGSRPANHLQLAAKRVQRQELQRARHGGPGVVDQTGQRDVPLGHRSTGSRDCIEVGDVDDDGRQSR